MSAGAIVLTDVLSIALPAAWIIWLLRRRRGYHASTELSRRGNVLAHGVVESDTAPVTVEYEQRRWAMDASSAARRDGKTLFRWEEQKRTIHAQPFVLRTPALRIQVNPDEDDVSLMWGPDHTVKTELESHRIRRTILEPGTSVEIFGSFQPAPAGGDPYRDGAALPTLVPSRVERLLVSKRPIAPKFVAMRRYLRARATVVAAAAGVAHVAIRPVLAADVAQLGLAMPGDTVRAWVGIAFAALACYFWRTKRPWRDGKLVEVMAK
jgi:hypothetical protein